MVELELRPDPLKPGWYSMNETQHLTPEGSQWRIITRPHIWRPPTDVYETEDNIVVRIEIAGMKESDFSISLEDRFLTIRGIRGDVIEKRAYHQMEIPFGEFVSEVELPSAIILESVEAVYRDGYLRIVLPKVRPQHIHVGE